MKRTQSYFMYSLFGAIFGFVITSIMPLSLGDHIGHGITNMFIYGGIGYSIFAIKSKEYKKLWNFLLFLLLAEVLPVLIFIVVNLFFYFVNQLS